MKRLKTFLGAFLVAVMFAGLAVAGWNIQQGDRGETSWVNEKGLSIGAGGGSTVTVMFTNVSDAWTRYIPLPRPGVVTRMHVTMDGAHPVNSTVAEGCATIAHTDPSRLRQAVQRGVGRRIMPPHCRANCRAPASGARSRC